MTALSANELCRLLSATKHNRCLNTLARYEWALNTLQTRTPMPFYSKHQTFIREAIRTKTINHDHINEMVDDIRKHK